MFQADVTGKEITETLLAAVRRLPNVTILEHVAVIDLLAEEASGGDEEQPEGGCGLVCRGVRAVPVSAEASVATIEELRGETDAAQPARPEGVGEPFEIRAANTLLATGGIGGVYQHSTNFPSSRAMRASLPASMALSRSTSTTCRFIPRGCIRTSPGGRF